MSDNLYSSSYRTDEKLDAILEETAEWAIHVRRGRILCFASSLRDALDKSAAHAGSGITVEVLTRRPSDDIVVHAAQITRMQRHIVGLEIAAKHERLRSRKAPRPQLPTLRLRRTEVSADQITVVPAPGLVAPPADTVESNV